MEYNINKINTIGKVSRIFLIFVRIALIVAIVAGILTVIAATQLNDNYITANGTVDGQVIVDSKQDNIWMTAFDFPGSEIEKTHIRYKGIELDVDENDLGDGKTAYTVSGAIDNEDLANYKSHIIIASILGCVVSVAGLIMTFFGSKLASAFEHCKTPFEDEVVTRIKAFALSMIPWAVIKCIGADGLNISLSTILLVLIVNVLATIFSYGAELQRVNDDTV